MALIHSTVVDAPIDDVFAWHERPGAIQRLTPPWQPMRVAQEASSLRDGQAVLAFPLGVRWVAQHSGYQPPHQFVDELTSLPLHWRHRHEFTSVDSGHTRVTDHLDTPVPAAVLRSTFTYRHTQLADDLAAHRWAAQRGGRPLTVAMTGASGMIGTALAAFLTTGGHRVIRLVRHEPQGAGERRWNTGNPDPELLSGVDAVVHLAGASIAGRFNDRHRRAIRNSRIAPTAALAKIAAAQGIGTFVSASAIGYYGADRGDEELTEDAERGDGFLADVVTDWEAATEPATQAGSRVVLVRTGIVQSPKGGVLRLQWPLFATGLGGRLGDGRQWLSWIGIDDLVDVYHRALVDTALSGPVNAVAPEPVRNSDYTRTLAHVLRRPALLPVPALGPKVLLGEQGARELAMASQRVVPAKLAAAGHRYRRAELAPALRHLLGHAPDNNAPA